MLAQLLAERFVLTRGGRYLDLATGGHVLVRVMALDAIRMREWIERCASEQTIPSGSAGPLADADAPSSLGSCAGALVDYGMLGSRGCFEARSTSVEAVPLSVASLEAVVRFTEIVSSAAAGPRADGVRVLHVPQVGTIRTRELCSHLARRLRLHGYVVVAACGDLPDQVLAALCHRHVAVICFTRGECERAAGWVRRLGESSPRAHLVVDASGGNSSIGTVRLSMRERPPAYAALHLTSRHLARADTFTRRRRLAAATRYLRAAVASAHRHGDGALQVQTAARLIALLAQRGEFDGACRAASRLLREVPRYPERFEAVQLAADTLVACGELADADRLLSTVAAECALARASIPAGVLLCHVGLCFWQGRFDRAATVLESVAVRNADTAIWRGLLGWARGDTAAWRDALQALHGVDSAIAQAWKQAIELLCHVSEGDDAAALAATKALAGREHTDDLLRAVLLEALGQRDLTAAAAGAAGEFVRGRVAWPLYALLVRWILTEPKLARQPSGDLMRDVQRRGMQGILRWGLRKEGVHVIQSVPRLLQIVTDAEDDVSALSHACAWIEEQPGVAAVSILAAGEGRVVAGAPTEALALDTVDLQDAIRSPRPCAIVKPDGVVVMAPIRYGGRTIASVIARGQADAAETMKALVETTAPLCAAAVRGRLDAMALAASRDAQTPELIGRSPCLTAVRDAIARAAATSFPVLIEGESGTGKELVARALHRLGARRDRRFCAVNCAALTDELVEAELFGYARGAFTGAIGARAGLFEEAHQGTLFLDEIRELSARAQAKLLRALQEREIRRLGENLPRPVDVRIVAATNQPLGQAASHGDFREDLVFRLAVVRIRMPPLRDRVEDLPLLAHAFWRQMSAQTGTRARLGPDALAALAAHRWPGNVRELQNAIAALVVQAPGRGRVSARHVHEVLAEPAAHERPAQPLEDARRAFERNAIAAALARHGGRRSAAARELGLTRQGLLKAIRRVGLQDDRGRAGVA